MPRRASVTVLFYLASVRHNADNREMNDAVAVQLAAICVSADRFGSLTC
jgi:hypothetical protein